MRRLERRTEKVALRDSGMEMASMAWSCQFGDGPSILSMLVERMAQARRFSGRIITEEDKRAQPSVNSGADIAGPSVQRHFSDKPPESRAIEMDGGEDNPAPEAELGGTVIPCSGMKGRNRPWAMPAAVCPCP